MLTATRLLVSTAVSANEMYKQAACALNEDGELRVRGRRAVSSGRCRRVWRPPATERSASSSSARIVRLKGGTRSWRLHGHAVCGRAVRVVHGTDIYQQFHTHVPRLGGTSRVVCALCTNTALDTLRDAFDPRGLGNTQNPSRRPAEFDPRAEPRPLDASLYIVLDEARCLAARCSLDASLDIASTPASMPRRKLK